jgi:predicted Rossmann fold nucleotide-binding protein DprA/Smf involved in DNA uptake
VTTADEVAELAVGAHTTGGSVATNLSVSDPSADSSLTNIHPFAVRVMDELSVRSARTPEKLARDSGLSVDQTTAILGLLHMSGIVSERSTGWVRKP